MKIKKTIKITAIIALSAIVAIIAYLLTKPDNDPSIKEKIHLLKAYSTVMRFKIVQPQSENGQDEEGFILVAKFFNLDEDMVGRLESSFDADSIVFDFQRIRIDDKYIFFPETMLFLKKGKINKKIDLKKNYTINNSPGIYFSKIIDHQLSKQISQLYNLLNNQKFETIEKKFGIYSHYNIVLKKPKPRELYSLRINIDGSVSIN